MNREWIYERLGFALMWLCIYFSPIQPFFLSIGFFILADSFLGVIVAVKNNGWLSVKSWGIWRAFAKLTSAALFLMVANIIQQQWLLEVECVKIVGGGLILAELKSLDEKAQELYGVSIYKFILDKLKTKRQ